MTMNMNVPWGLRPPEIVKTLTMLHAVALEIEALKHEVATLPIVEQTFLRTELEHLECRARQLRETAQRFWVSH